MAILRVLKNNNTATQNEIAEKMGKSVRTVRRLMASLTTKGVIKRENGKRNGFWAIKSDC